MCSDKGAVHVVRCVLLLEAVCLGGFKRDAATLVVGLDQLKIALAARDDDTCARLSAAVNQAAEAI